MKKLINFIKAVFKEFSEDKVGMLSAAFAYVAIFSIGPLILVLLSIVGLVYGPKAASGELFSQLSTAVGPQTAKTIENAVAHTYHSGSNVVALVLGVAGVLFAAAALTTQLQNSFDIIFGIVPDPKAGIKRTVYVKSKNIILVLLGGLVVTASVIASTLASGLGEKAQDSLGLPAITLEITNELVSAAILVGMLYLVFRVLPDLVIPRRVALAAACVVAALFLVGKVVLAVIIGNNGTASAYGAAASLVTLLLWVYYSGQLLFLGAEGIKVHAYNTSQSYDPKRFTLKRETIHLDSNTYVNRLVDAFARGYRKRDR
jgi:membrane protein